MTKAEIKAGLAAITNLTNGTIRNPLAQLKVYGDNAAPAGAPATDAAIKAFFAAIAGPLAELTGIAESDLS